MRMRRLPLRRLKPRRHPWWGQGYHGRRRCRCHRRCGTGGCSICCMARRGTRIRAPPRGRLPLLREDCHRPGQLQLCPRHCRLKRTYPRGRLLHPRPKRSRWGHGTLKHRSRSSELTRERAAATPRATPARHVACGEAMPQPAAQVPPAKIDGPPSGARNARSAGDGWAGPSVRSNARPGGVPRRAPHEGASGSGVGGTGGTRDGRGRPTRHQRAACTSPRDIWSGHLRQRLLRGPWKQLAAAACRLQEAAADIAAQGDNER